MTNGERSESSLPTATGDISSYTTRDASGRLATWKGQRVQYDDQGRACYKRQNGGLERIWFPDGPPPAQKVNTMGEMQYPEGLVNIYQNVKESMSFQGDAVPELPPTIDMTRWDI